MTAKYATHQSVVLITRRPAAAGCRLRAADLGRWLAGG